MHHPTDRIIHTTAFVKPVVEHLLEREIAQWVHPMKDRSNDPSHHERTLLPWSYILLRWLYDIGHMLKDHSESDRGNPLLPRLGLLFPISSKVVGVFTITHRQNSTFHCFCYTRCGAQWVHHKGSI